ncbi:MAG: ABC transporter permease subunit [Bacillota bacterium]|nr:ABC transporter permease subunit [Bacillota bacterium]
MNIYRFELKSNFKSFLVWVLCLSFVTIGYMAFFPMIHDSIGDFTKMLNNFNPILKDAMGIATSTFSTAIGFYGFVFIYVSLMMAIQAMNLGIGILSKEERERTADFLITKPVSRITIVSSKLLAALTVFLATDIIFSIVTYIQLSNISDENVLKPYLLINLSLLFIQILCFSIGFFISTILKKIRAVLPISLGIVFAFFAISRFLINDDNKVAKYFSPFSYFDTNKIIKDNTLDITSVVVFAAVVIVCISASYVLYHRRNVHSV